MTKTFSRLLASGVLVAGTVAALPAAAAPLYYVFTPAAANGTALSFMLESKPTPTYRTADYFDVTLPTSANNAAPAPDVIRFFTADNLYGGGFYDYGSFVNTFGPQLYAGTVAQPTMLTGLFTLYTTANHNTVAGTLSVTDAAAAVPEPATWAMLVFGVGAVGIAKRRRQKVTTRVSYAA